MLKSKVNSLGNPFKSVLVIKKRKRCGGKDLQKREV